MEQYQGRGYDTVCRYSLLDMFCIYCIAREKESISKKKIIISVIR